jgi:Raf kinase inhibitor-like YbhB/YbcL family protein
MHYSIKKVEMKLSSNSFEDGGWISGQFAFCVTDPARHVAFSRNSNPHFKWSGVPEAALSLALVCHDPDAPSRADDVNVAGKSIPADLPRVDFFHWTLIDIPSDIGGIAAGSFSDTVTAGGKPGSHIADLPAGESSMRQGLNDYTGWFAGNAGMAGQYFGYDGPCPPWNDSVVHRYIFTIYALDVRHLPVDGVFDGAQVLLAMSGHVLAQASMTGYYSLNPQFARDA